MKCLNLLCQNQVLKHRIVKQTKCISRWYFCLHCWKYERIYYKCHYKYCDNLIYPTKMLQKFCSKTCQSRHNYGTKPDEIRVCRKCGKEFTSKRGIKQIYCEKRCRVDATSLKRGKIKLCKYCSKTFNSRKGLTLYCSTSCRDSDDILNRSIINYKKALKRRTSKRSRMKNSKENIRKYKNEWYAKNAERQRQYNRDYYKKRLQVATNTNK